MLLYNYSKNKINKVKPTIVEIKVRVKLTAMNEFLEIYDKRFKPVDDAVGRNMLMFFYDSISHFNLMFLYKYRDFDEFKSMIDEYPRA